MNARPANRLRLRRLTAKGLKAALALWRATEGVGLNESDTSRALRDYLRRNPGLSFGVWIDGRLVGAVLCGHDGRRGYLHHLAVAREHRGAGLGRLLVQTCLARLRERRIPRCNVFLFTDNSTGRRFWQHLGWHERDDLQVLQAQTRQR
jgi:putative acetyltransferase